MAHVLLGLYILSFSLGAVVVAFGAATYRRLRVAFFGSFSLQFAGSTLIILCEGIRTYNEATGGALSPAVHLVLLVLKLSGGALLGWALPLFSLHLTSAVVTRGRLLVNALLAFAVGAAGAVSEALSSQVAYAVEYLVLFGLYGYGCFILARNTGRIEDPGIRRLTKRFLFLAAALSLPGTAQLVIRFIPAVPRVLHAYPYTQIVYFLASVALLFEFAARPPEAAAAESGCLLPADFVVRYGITPRECDIITMMEKGNSNRQLAETLFISARTVKNHVYHIYQKTGVANKVQLVNLVRTFQANGNGRGRPPAAARVDRPGKGKSPK